MARDSLFPDYVSKGVIPDENDSWVGSLWRGYLEGTSIRNMKIFFKLCLKGYIHSSGHAPSSLLQRFATAMRPKVLPPIHGEAWTDHVKAFENSVCLTNGEWVTIP